MKAILPNLITSVRFLMALVFFVLMECYQYVPESPTDGGMLDWAFTIFVFTALTDILDGYLARRWKKESTFGRILDPLVDKVLVIGAFLYLAGDHFVILERGVARNVTGVAGWMVVLILIRELLVTGLRGFSEAKGLSFKATIPGKIKMFVQCFAAGTVMVITGHSNSLPAWQGLFLHTSLWAMVIVTVFSMLVYIERARSLLANSIGGDKK
jgi:CDP-diacylglycerol--glycerol-3-phosphate 3-phosphatidyltransferase